MKKFIYKKTDFPSRINGEVVHYYNIDEEDHKRLVFHLAQAVGRFVEMGDYSKKMLVPYDDEITVHDVLGFKDKKYGQSAITKKWWQTHFQFLGGVLNKLTTPWRGGFPSPTSLQIEYMNEIFYALGLELVDFEEEEPLMTTIDKGLFRFKEKSEDQDDK